MFMFIIQSESNAVPYMVLFIIKKTVGYLRHGCRSSGQGVYQWLLALRKLLHV